MQTSLTEASFWDLQKDGNWFPSFLVLSGATTPSGVRSALMGYIGQTKQTIDKKLSLTEKSCYNSF